jgi:Peptidase propeptide and YPEB domain
MRTQFMFAAAATLFSVATLNAQEPEEWYLATGTTCSSVDVSAAKSVEIKTDKYDAATMISPDSAKTIALCAVPGQIGSGEMNVKNGRAEYAIDIIPNKKKTHTKVIVDAQTGAVLSSKQFGGLRGITGWVRESAEHKKNAKP